MADHQSENAPSRENEEKPPVHQTDGSVRDETLAVNGAKEKTHLGCNPDGPSELCNKSDAAQNVEKGDTSPNADVNAAVEFLRKFRPDGPWVLTSIINDRGKTITCTFRVDQLDLMKRWIELEGASRKNLYFTVNSTGDKNHTKKPSKQDIVAAEWLHVDVDPDGSDRRGLRQRLEGHHPPPTLIIDSGGGFQGFWRLENSVPLPDVSACEQIEAHNRHIATVLGGDHCHNVDRIMRLPGTVNWPNRKKRDIGRVPALARVVSWDTQRECDLSALPKGDTSTPRAVAAVRVDNFDDLEISDRTKMLIVQGHDPENPDRWPSRSEAFWHVLCQLVRDHIPDEVIAGVLTDPDLLISQHALSQPNPAAYIERQLDRAHSAPMPLHEFNEENFAAISGGRVRFYREHAMAAMPRETFDYIHKPHKLERQNAKNETVQVPITKLWHDWPDRRFYEDGFILDPDKPGHTATAYNLWRGFSVEAAAGDVTPFMRHLQDVIEPDGVDYVWKWICWKIQNPARKPKVALVLRGEEGTGKGFIGQCLMRLFGHHALQLVERSHVTGKFNAHMRHLCLLFADEADFGSEDHDGVLKALITEDKISIEAKGVDLEPVDSYLGVFMSTNSTFPVPTGKKSRRYVLLDVLETHREEHEYFAALFGWMENGGLSALLHAAQSEDLGRWHPAVNRIETRALEQSRFANMGTEEGWVFNALANGWGRNEPEDDHWLASKAIVGEDGNAIKKCRQLQCWLDHEERRKLFAKKRVGGAQGWQLQKPIADVRDQLFPGHTWGDEELADIPF